MTATGQLGEFFTQLDHRLDELYIENYAISVTTLEEVFLKVAKGDNSNKYEEQNDSENNRKDQADENFNIA